MLRMQRIEDMMENGFRAGIGQGNLHDQLVSGQSMMHHPMRGRTRDSLLLNNAFSSGSGSAGSVSSNDSRVGGVNPPSNGVRVSSTVRGTSATTKNVTGRNGCRHTKRSPSERRFKCDQVGCERMFFTRKDVKRHMVVHTGVRNFPCPFCQQRFGRKDHLVRHAKKSHNRDTRTSALNAYASSSPSSLHHQQFLSPQPPSAHKRSQSGQNTLPMRDTSVSHHQSGSNGHPSCCSTSSSSPPDHHSILILSGANGSNGSYHHSPVHQGVSDAHQFASSMMAHHHNLHHQQQADQLHHSLANSQAVQSHNSVAQLPHAMVKTETGTPPGPSYFTFPVASTPPFVSHSLMSHPFVPSSPRSLYSSPVGPSAFSVNAVHGMPLGSSQLSAVMCGEHVGHPSSVAMSFSHAENPQLPHFSQAFQ